MKAATSISLTTMKRPSFILIALFLGGSILWMAFHAKWQGVYVVEKEYGQHSYLIDLDGMPLWSRPPAPTFADFSERFSDGEEPLPAGGRIGVHHEWQRWLLELMMIWLIGSLFITPTAAVFRHDPVCAVIARVGAGLIGAAIVCFFTWMAIGGWGPPPPLFFGIAGILGGSIWAATHVRRHAIANKSA